MRYRRCLRPVLLVLVFSVCSATAAVPRQINYQGRVVVGGTNYNGSGSFKFALVSAVTTNGGRTATATATSLGGMIMDFTVTDGGAGYVSAPTVTIDDPAGSGAAATAVVVDGCVSEISVDSGGINYSPFPTIAISDPPVTVSFSTYWSNDGTSDGEPANAVPLTVDRGLFSLGLGDTSLANMMELPSSVFTNNEVYLRVWFNGGSGFEQLSPDQRIASVGYAMRADGVAPGGITSAMLADNAVTANKLAAGAVGSSSLATGAVSSANLAVDAVTSSALADGTIISADIQNGAIVDADISPSAAIAPSKIAGTAATEAYVANAVTSNVGAVEYYISPLNIVSDDQGEDNVHIAYMNSGGETRITALADGVVYVYLSLPVSSSINGTPLKVRSIKTGCRVSTSDSYIGNTRVDMLDMFGGGGAVMSITNDYSNTSNLIHSYAVASPSPITGPLMATYELHFAASGDWIEITGVKLTLVP